MCSSASTKAEKMSHSYIPYWQEKGSVFIGTATLNHTSVNHFTYLVKGAGQWQLDDLGAVSLGLIAGEKTS